MYQTLVNKNTGRIIQFVQGGTEARFDVHEGFMWVDGPYELEPKDYGSRLSLQFPRQRNSKGRTNSRSL